MQDKKTAFGPAGITKPTSFLVNHLTPVGVRWLRLRSAVLATIHALMNTVWADSLLSPNTLEYFDAEALVCVVTAGRVTV